MKANFSPCGRYRYTLERQCQGEGKTVVIMVNPSTADATEDDATIRKIIGFGNRNQWGRVVVVNMFAFKATDIKDLAKAEDPIGPMNDLFIRLACLSADRIIVAWGPTSKLPARLRDRWWHVWRRLPACPPVLCIGEPTNSGHPRHPLMPPYSLPLQDWQPPASLL